MNQIELFQLAPYLPYELKGVFTHLPGFREFELTEIIINKYNEDYDDNVDVTGKCGVHGGETADIENFKPILRPMSDLDKLIPNDEEERKYSDLGYFIKPGNGHPSVKIGIHDLHYSDAQILIYNHFDVFGLIKKGLAIDINTLKS